MADEIVNADVVIGDVLNVTVDNVSETVTVTQTTSQEILNATIVPGTKGEPGDPGPAGADAPSDHTLLTNIGTNTHAQIDTAISNSVSHIANTSNPHGVTKAQVGLSNVPNTDFTAAVAANTAARHTHANKTLLDTYSQTEVNLADAVAKKHTHANSAVLDATTASFTTADETKLDGIAAGAQVNTVTSVNTRTGAVTGLAEASDLTAHTSNTSNPHSVTKAQVGLGNVDNTADSAKPISTATKSYVDAADAAHLSATDPHPQYMNSDRGDARYAGQPYAVMAKSQFASLSSSYGTLGSIFSNDGYKNDLQVYGLSTQASTPTPDTPVPIVGTTGNVTVRSDNKNLVRVIAAPVTKNGISYGTNTATGLVTFSGTSTAQDIFFFDGGVRTIPIVAGQTYRISQPPGFSNTTWFAEGSVLYNNGTTLYPSLSPFTATDNGMTMLYLVVRNGQSPSNISYYPQLEVGATSTAFEKNTTSTKTLPLGTTQLRSLPNGVSDRIYKDGSTWKLEQNVAREFFDGSESWVLDTGFDASYYRFLRYSPTNHFSNTGMNNRFTNRGATAHGAYEYVYNLAGSNSFYIHILASRLTVNTVVALKTWLASNNIESLYELPTPITTTITDPTLITALENIRTYQGVTNITASTPVSGSYGLDINAMVAASTAAKLSKTGDTATGKMTFNAGIAIADNQNIALSATTGTRIGTSTTQKLGFYNATPVVRPTATPANATDLATALTLINDLKAKLRSLGLID